MPSYLITSMQEIIITLTKITLKMCHCSIFENGIDQLFAYDFFLHSEYETLMLEGLRRGWGVFTCRHILY
jgi:hypothetical protein